MLISHERLQLEAIFTILHKLPELSVDAEFASFHLRKMTVINHSHLRANGGGGGGGGEDDKSHISMSRLILQQLRWLDCVFDAKVVMMVVFF